MYNQVKEGSRAKEYENALLWLSDCGLIHKISRISKSSIPLSAYEDLKSFKVYLLDVGLLCALSEIPLFYWSRECGDAEVNFVIQTDDKVLPVEVKAERNLQAKSLKVYYGKYTPDFAIRVFMADYERQD